MDVLSLDSFFSLDGGEVGSSVVEEMGGMPQLNWRGEVLGEWNDTRGQFRVFPNFSFSNANQLFLRG